MDSRWHSVCSHYSLIKCFVFSVWAILLSREQTQTALILLPLTLFVDPNGSRPATGDVILLYEEQCASWISVRYCVLIVNDSKCLWFFQAHNLTHFLGTSNITDRIEFLFTSEKHGYQHIYLEEVRIHSGKRRVLFLCILICIYRQIVAKSTHQHSDHRRSMASATRCRSRR